MLRSTLVGADGRKLVGRERLDQWPRSRNNSTAGPWSTTVGPCKCDVPPLKYADYTDATRI